MKALLFSVSLFVATFAGLEAKTVKHPEKDPAFTITFPDDWSVAPDREGNLRCKAGNGSNFAFSIQKLPAKTEKEIKAYLRKIVQGIFGDPTSKIEELKERTTSNDVRLFAITCRGPIMGQEMFYSVTAFSPEEGTWFGIPIVHSAEVIKAHEKVMNEIWNSIKFVSDANED